MKLHSILIIMIINLNFLYCKENKIKINENYIKSIITKFYPEIKLNLERVEVKSPHIIFFGISDLTLDKFEINIIDNERINLRLKGVTLGLFGNRKRVGCLIRNGGIRLENFMVEVNFKINGKYNSLGEYIPGAELLGNPISNYTPKAYGLNQELYDSMIKNGEAKNLVTKILKDQINKILSIIIENYQKRVNITP